MPCEGGGNCVESVGTGSVVEPENNSGSVFNMIWDRIFYIIIYCTVTYFWLTKQRE